MAHNKTPIATDLLPPGAAPRHRAAGGSFALLGLMLAALLLIWQLRISDRVTHGASRWEAATVNGVAAVTLTGLVALAVFAWRRWRGMRLALRALRDSEARFRAMFDYAPLGVALATLDRHLILVNPAYERLFGYTADELGHLTFPTLTHPDDAAADQARLAELVAGTSDDYRIEKRYFRKDGRLVWGSLTVSLVRDAAGTPQYIIGMVEDITTIRAIGAALVASREEERRHLARELHDGPVQDLVALRYLLETRPAEDAAPLGYDRLGDILAHLRGVIGKLRPAGLDGGDLPGAIEEYVAQLRREVGEAGPTIMLDLDRAAGALPSPFAHCLFRIAQEGVRNALAHAHARRVVLTLRLDPHEAVLVVRDDGRGFVVPARLSTLTRQNHFGLVGIAERVEWLGGQLSIQSAPNAGTVLTARLLRVGERGHDGHADPSAAGG